MYKNIIYFLINNSLFFLFFLIFFNVFVVSVLFIYRSFFNYKDISKINVLYLFKSITSGFFLFSNSYDCFVYKPNVNLYLNPFFIEIINFKISKLESLFIFVISTISFFANRLTLFYLNDDKKRFKFSLMLNWFSISMILFVIHNNFFTLILTWELLGLTSFFLISHYENFKSLKSAMSAYFFNRISDIYIFLIVITIFFSLNIQNIYVSNSFSNNIEIIFCVSITLCSFKKSAVIFFKWLPDSMEAPLPASALIHSATLVSAGIYLNLKYNIFFNNLNMLVFLQFLTISFSFLSACFAAYQTDIKKILAYSTIANCSFIYYLIFTKNLEISALYFMLHGFFKSMVFIYFGYAILKNKHKQDTR